MRILTQKLEARLKRSVESGRLRCLSAQDPGRIDFSSNDYLGLARSSSDTPPPCNQALSGSGGSRLLYGTTDRMLAIERELASFYAAEAALVFSSGYQANLGLLSALPRRGDFIVYDEYIHASVRDGIRLGFARSAHFSHNSVNALKATLERVSASVSGTIFVVIESLYSMDGDFAPLEEILSVTEFFDAALIIDEAHSTGIYGNHGEGLSVQHDLHDRIFARVHTFGKGVGLHGACVVGSKVLIDALINYSRPFIYSTAPAPKFFEEIMHAHQRVAASHTARVRLHELGAYFNLTARQYDIPLLSEDSAIKAILLPGTEYCKSIATDLQNDGYDIRAIVPPTVPEGAERLRICLHSFNTETEIQGIVSCIASHR